jgi:hypothetical protein
LKRQYVTRQDRRSSERRIGSLRSDSWNKTEKQIPCRWKRRIISWFRVRSNKSCSGKVLYFLKHVINIVFE